MEIATKETKQQKIKRLYKSLKEKYNFIHELAEYYNLQPTSIRSHWFSNFWIVPMDKQDEVIEKLEQRIAEQ